MRSGAVYSKEPTNWPELVSESSPSIWAMPKSVRTTLSVRPEQDVRGLHIAVEDPAGVGRAQGPGHRPGDPRGFLLG